MKIKLLLICFISTISFSCTSPSYSLYAPLATTSGVDTPIPESNFSDLVFLPVEPREIHLINRLGDGPEFKQTPVRFADLNQEQIKEILGLEDWVSSVKRIESGGNLGYTGSSLSGTKGDYIVNIYYTRYTPLTLTPNDDNRATPNVQAVRIGVGVMIEATVKTYEANLNIGSIPGLTSALNRKKASGTIKVRKIGVESGPIDFIKAPIGALSPQVLDEASAYIEKVDTAVKAPGAKLKPYIIAHGFRRADIPSPAPAPKQSFWGRIFGKKSD